VVGGSRERLESRPEKLRRRLVSGQTQWSMHTGRFVFEKLIALAAGQQPTWTYCFSAEFSGVPNGVAPSTSQPAPISAACIGHKIYWYNNGFPVDMGSIAIGLSAPSTE